MTPTLPPTRPWRRASRAAVLLRVAAVLALAVAAWVAREVLLLGFVSVLLAVVLSFPVGWLARFTGRGAAVLMVLAVVAGAVAGLGVLVAPAVADQAAQIRDSAPRALARARAWLERVERVAVPPAAKGAGPPPPSAGDALAARAAEQAVPALAGVVAAVTEVVLVIVLAAFLVHAPGEYRNGLRRLVPPERETVFDTLWERLDAGLRRWVGGVLVAMSIMGTLTALGLLAAGIEGWFLLGLLTFLGTFVPYVGAVASAVPGLLVALSQSPRHFTAALVVYAGVHVVEGYLVEPFVMRRAVSVQPALLLAGQAVFGAVFGLLGVVVATPALVCLRLAVSYLWVERRLGKG